MGFLNPYAFAIKVGLVVLLVATLVGGCLALRLARAERDAAALRAETLGASLVAHIQNADAVTAIMADAAEKERRLRVRVGSLSEEVRRAKITVSQECRPMLAPLERARDGVLQLRRERDGAAPAGSFLRPRSGAAGLG